MVEGGYTACHPILTVNVVMHPGQFLNRPEDSRVDWHDPLIVC